MTAQKPIIAILGGTGDLGGGLAVRWSRAGYKIIIGSRTLEKALDAAKPLGAAGMDNVSAAQACDIAVLTVPFANQKATLESVRDAAGRQNSD